MEDPGERVTLCPDGKYRWLYERSLLRDLSVLFTVLKIFLAIAAVMGVIAFIINLSDNDAGEALRIALEMVGIMLLIMIPLSILGYFVYAAMMGWKYCVVFTLDENAVVHEQYEPQAEKAKLISGLGTVVGAASGRATLAGVAAMSARTTMCTRLKDARTLRMDRRKNTIHVNMNEVYAKDEDLDMVWDFLVAHCPDAEIKG